MHDHDNPVLAAIFGRRSIRRFTAEPVSTEALRTILEAGRWAPSGLNNQPWRFLALWPGDPRAKALEDCTKYAHILRGAGALVAVFLDREAMYSELKDHQTAGAAIQNMLLAAHALGLGGVWLGEIVNQAPQVLQVLGLDSEAYAFMALLALGHPDQKGSSSRKPLEELMIGELTE
jgi:nitroreductase